MTTGESKTASPSSKAIAPGRSCTLSYDQGEGEVKNSLSKQRCVLGRSDDCDLMLPFDAISRRHASLERHGAEWRIRDLDSLNGVFVNDLQIAGERTLADHDKIRLGVVELTFLHGELEPADAPPRVLIQDTGEISSTTVFRMNGFDPFASAGDASSPGMVAVASPAAGVAADGAPATDASWVFDVIKRATQMVFECKDLDELLERLMDFAFELLPAERGAICLYDSQSDSLEPQVARIELEGSVEEVVISRAIAEEVLKTQKSVLFSDVMADVVSRSSETLMSRGIRSAICAPFFRDDETVGLIYLDTRSRKRAFTENDLRMLSTITLISAMGVQHLRLRDRVAREHKIKNRLTRYFSPDVVDRILLAEDTGSESLPAEEREVTVLFCDLHRFTRLSETLTPSAVANLLNEMLGELAEIVFSVDGTIDKFTGDGLIAVFGAPFDQDDHAVKSVRAALRMREAIQRIDAKSDLELPVVMRFGINTGTVVAGDIGGPLRREYTVVGDTVNVASRLESVVAAPGDIVIGEKTQALVHEVFALEALEPMQVRGRVGEVVPFRVIGPIEEETSEREPPEE